MNENAAEPVAGNRAAPPADAVPGAQAESTLTFGPAARPEDTSAVPMAMPVDESGRPLSTGPDERAETQLPGRAPGEAERPTAARDKSLSFLAPGKHPMTLGRLGHYEVLELLGRGAFGIVLKALDEKLNRLVAIKVLGPQLVRNAEARTRFVREARAVAAVNSKHVVATYAVEEAPVPYLVMEYVAGETLQDRLDRGGAFDLRDVLRLGAEIAAGLAAAHETGLIHRDIKPANILIEGGAHRHAKIADFGLARAVDDAALTQSGVIAGTPKYMSPEQARGEALDHRSDLFSLGSVLYTMCTGLPPFRAPKTLAVLKRVCDNDPQPIREINPDIPAALAAVVDRLLVKDPAGRIQSAAAAAALLEGHLARLDDPSLPVPADESDASAPEFAFEDAPPRSKVIAAPKAPARRWPWVVAAVVVLAAVGSAVTAAVAKLSRDRAAPAAGASEEPRPTAKPTSPPIARPAAQPKAPDPVAEKNPFNNAKVGDWADYTMTLRGAGPAVLTLTLRQEVVAKTERSLRVREVIFAPGQGSASAEWDVDLDKPFDAADAPSFIRGAGAVEKVGSGRETIRVGGKDYDATWTQTKLRAKVREGDLEASTKCWTAPGAPLGGMIKLEHAAVATAGAERQETSATFELTDFGHKRSPKDAQAAASRGDWAAAAAQYASVFEGRALDDGELGFERAAVLLLAGDEQGYRAVCAEMLKRGGTWDVRPYHVARAFTLTPDAAEETALAGRRAGDELKKQGAEFWSLTEQGALAFRAGRYDDAGALFQKSLRADDKPARAVINWLWLALTERRRGNAGAAREWLAKATEWLDKHPPGDPIATDDTGFHLHNWLEATILHREAERALRPEVAPPPREVK